MKSTNKQEFSKALLIQESILIWIITIAFIVLAFCCIKKGYTGSLPWISSLVSFPWTAYGVSQAFYYNKAKAENTTEFGLAYHKEIAQTFSSEEDIDIDYGV